MERAVHEQFLKTPENRRLYQQEKLLVEATELLAEVMERKNMTRAELARTIGKSKAFVTQVLRGNQNMTLRTLADLFGAMRYEVILQALPYHPNRGAQARRVLCPREPEPRIGILRPARHDEPLPGNGVQDKIRRGFRRSRPE